MGCRLAGARLGCVDAVAGREVTFPATHVAVYFIASLRDWHACEGGADFLEGVCNDSGLPRRFAPRNDRRRGGDARVVVG